MRVLVHGQMLEQHLYPYDAGAFEWCPPKVNTVYHTSYGGVKLNPPNRIQHTSKGVRECPLLTPGNVPNR